MMKKTKWKRIAIGGIIGALVGTVDAIAQPGPFIMLGWFMTSFLFGIVVGLW